MSEKINLTTGEMQCQKSLFSRDRNEQNFEWGRLFQLTILVLFVFHGLNIRADQPPSKTDSEAFQKIRKIIKDKNLIFQERLSKSSSESKFCQEFISALVDEGDEISVIEPYHRAANLGDPALQRWIECGNHPNISEGSVYSPVTGTQAFRVYKFDMAEDRRSEAENVLYAEWNYRDVSGPSGFLWWDLKACKVNGGAVAQQDDKRDANGIGPLGNNFALLVKYKNRARALTMSSLDSTWMKSWDDVWKMPNDYYLRLADLNPQLMKNPTAKDFGYACSWSTVNSGTDRK